MCGISGIFGPIWDRTQLATMVVSQQHRGPDGNGLYFSQTGSAGLGHNRLSIIDLSDAGRQPMSTPDGRYWIVFNGEIYNFTELRFQLSDYAYQSRTDTEVLLAAYLRWGEDCLHHLIGMFSFLIWDEHERRLFAARDRFGVKPLHYAQAADGTLLLASEIKALHAAGVPRDANSTTWATYLTYGIQDNSSRTFWKGINSVPAGHKLIWRDGAMKVSPWFDLADSASEVCDRRSVTEVTRKYLELLSDTVRLRFRSDVPVGINLSGGLDSATLLGVVQTVQGEESEVAAYTFITGDKNYDELPWVLEMLAHTRHPLRICKLQPAQVPALAASVQAYQDEPFGGLPTLCYARLFEVARADGVKVLLDGQGMDEQWAGYDYYSGAIRGEQTARILQGTRESPVRPACLAPEFRSAAEPFTPPQPFTDTLRNFQYCDARYAKIPRALRFNDRASMRSSTELREPFLDHRLFQLALNQPPERKIADGTNKWLLRQMTRGLLPRQIVEAPKRPLQTPQREWLRGPLRSWARELIEVALEGRASGWFQKRAVLLAWEDYCAGHGDNSFFVWQWISLGLIEASPTVPVPAEGVQDLLTSAMPMQSAAALAGI